MPRNNKLSLFALACAALVATNAARAAAVDNVMGGGLRQLVHEADAADARLAVHMSRHLHSAAGEPLVRVHLKNQADARTLLPRLAAAGLRVTAVSKLDPSHLEGYVSLRNARAVAGLDIVRSVAAIHRPMKSAGSVQSEAVALEKADIAQSKGYDGTGIKIGALSDSYDACSACVTHAAGDVTTGDLPAAGVTVLEDLGPGGGEDEGRAMLQLIHDVAPGAQLGFATAFGGEVDFSNQILALRSSFGADVIVDDVFYYDEPMYSDGLLAQTVDQVAAMGAAYYSSAGNNGLEAYEADFHPVAWATALQVIADNHIPLHLDQIPAELQPKSVHLFNGATIKRQQSSFSNRVTTAGDSVIDFQWDEPFYMGKVQTDYNIYVFDTDGNWIDPNNPTKAVFYTEDDNIATDAAMEIAEVAADGTIVKGGAAQNDYLIVIGKMNDGPANHFKYVAENTLAVSQFEGAPSVGGHNSAAHGQGVGAIYYGIPTFPEDFSSAGPVTIMFDGNGNRLRSPEIRQVPQIAAADGINNTFFGFDADLNGLPNFFGTSAAAPDAAATAALALQAAGGPGSMAPDDLYAVLQNTAKKVAVADQRLKTKANAGPVDFFIHGDWTRWGNYFELDLDKTATSAVSSITFDSTGTAGLVFSTNLARFYLGDAHGVTMSDITVSESIDQKQYTLTFAQDSFAPGDHFHFGTSVYNPIQGSTQEDADRMAGMTLHVTMADGTTYDTTVAGPKKTGINRFTGHGLVDSAAAIRAIVKGE